MTGEHDDRNGPSTALALKFVEQMTLSNELARQQQDLTKALIGQMQELCDRHEVIVQVCDILGSVIESGKRPDIRDFVVAFNSAMDDVFGDDDEGEDDDDPNKPEPVSPAPRRGSQD